MDHTILNVCFVACSSGWFGGLIFTRVGGGGGLFVLILFVRSSFHLVIAVCCLLSSI